MVLFNFVGKVASRDKSCDAFRGITDENYGKMIRAALLYTSFTKRQRTRIRASISTTSTTSGDGDGNGNGKTLNSRMYGDAKAQVNNKKRLLSGNKYVHEFYYSDDEESYV